MSSHFDRRQLRTRFLSIRLSASDYERILAAATKANPYPWCTVKVSDWARLALLTAAPVPTQLELPKAATGDLVAPSHVAGNVTRKAIAKRVTAASSKPSHAAAADDRPSCPACLHDDDALVLLVPEGRGFRCRRCEGRFNAKLDAIPVGKRKTKGGAK